MTALLALCPGCEKADMPPRPGSQSVERTFPDLDDRWIREAVPKSGVSEKERISSVHAPPLSVTHL